MKASDKQAVSKKLVTVLKKRYKRSPRGVDRPVLETILYAICLENSTVAQADTAYARLESTFHDLNEIRVSSITELADVFGTLEMPEWRALRVRSVLQHVFEKNFVFEFEALRRKTLELAQKHLLKIKELTPFVRAYTLQSALGSHILPADDAMTAASIWLGLTNLDSTPDQAMDDLKSAVRKADAPLFCQLLRSLATDPRIRKIVEKETRRGSQDEFDLATAPERLVELFARAEKSAKTTKKKATKKKAVKKGAAKKSAAKRTSAKGASRSSAARKKKTAVARKKTAAKKKTSKKAAKKKRTSSSRR